MREISVLMLLFICLVFSRCSKTYGIANFSSESTILLKPSFRDSTSTATYISGTLSHTVIAPEYNEHRGISLANFDYHKAISNKGHGVAYGGFLHAGNYQANSLSALKGGNKYFFGGGVTGESYVNIPMNSLDWRILGLKFTALTEHGAYSKFRSDAENSPNSGSIVNLSPSNISLNLTASTELVVKLKNADAGFSFSFGIGHQIVTTGQRLYYSRNNSVGFIQMAHSLQGGYLGVGFAKIIG